MPIARHGAVLIVLLAVFAVTMTLAGVWARRVVMEHRHQRRTEELVQARWLAVAGLRRAAARLIADPAYDGEEWLIADEDLERADSAGVVLTVETSDDSDGGAIRIVAQARYPDKQVRIRVTESVYFTPQNTERTP
jgi:type II secretory pathway component PulK